MSILDSHNEDERPLRVQNVPQAALNTHERNRAEAEADKMQNAVDEALAQDASAMADTEGYSLNDDRRVKTLSPTMLVIKRFLRNRVAMVGLFILAFMFLFSFLGGVLSPYGEAQLFYRNDDQNKPFAGVTENTDLRYIEGSANSFPSLARAKFTQALKAGDATFESKGVTYRYESLDEDIYLIHDDTFFKSGKNGFAITYAGFYCREMSDKKAHFVSWEDFADRIDPELGVDGYIRQDGVSICYFTDDDDVLCNQLISLYRRLYTYATTGR